jgi:integrase
VAASTQNQALSALLFLYRSVLEIELPMIDAVRATAPERLPVVLSVDEIRRVLNCVSANGPYRLMLEMMYGSGLRLLECCRLRVKDVDFERRQIIVREGKGDKDRTVPLPDRIRERLQRQIEVVRIQHANDVGAKGAAVGRASIGPDEKSELPYAATQLCDAFAGGGNGHSHNSRAAGPCGCLDDDDLHACHPTRSQRRDESAGPVVILVGGGGPP